jgi:hypothetical protein
MGAKGAGASIGLYADWLREHAHAYQGKWVALRDGRVIDSDPSRVELHRRIEGSPALADTLFYYVGEPA